MPNLLGHSKDRILMVCDELCGKKTGRRSKQDTWWWNRGEGGNMKKKRKMHTSRCVEIVLRRIRTGIKA